jgi:predicted ATPase
VAAWLSQHLDRPKRQLIGPNASGKSNLLRFFEMLSASARGELEKYVQREGGMEPLVWDGSASSIELIVELARQDNVPIGSRCGLELNRLGKTSAYRIGFEFLDDLGASGAKWIDRSPGHTVLLNEEQRKIGLTNTSEVETILSAAGGPLSPSSLGGPGKLKKSLRRGPPLCEHQSRLCYPHALC